MSLRILIVGAGAVGGYFGARLAAAGRDVTFLVREKRAQQLRKDGLRISSPHGDFQVEPKLITATEIKGPFDVILLSVKAYALEGAMSDFAPAVGPETMIIPALNGMSHIERLEERFGDSVLGGACRIVAHVNASGHIVQANPMHSLVYGERSGTATTRLEMLDEALQNAGFDASISNDIVLAMWEKWVQLASLGAVTCLLGGSVGQVAAARGGLDTANAIVDEALAVCAASGHPLSDEFASRAKKAVTLAGSPLTSSMYRDRQDGAQVEVEQIIGDLVDLGDQNGVAAPLLRAAAVSLRMYQAGLSRG